MLVPATALDATQWTGIVGFAIAALACAAAARRQAGAWPVLAAAQTVFAVEVANGWRHRLHDAVDRLLAAHGAYADRAPTQIAALVLVALLALGVLGVLLRPASDRRSIAARVAAAATVMTAVLFGVETISWHLTDAALYADWGPARAIAFAWAALATVVAIAAWCAARAPRSADPQAASAPAGRV